MGFRETNGENWEGEEELKKALSRAFGLWLLIFADDDDDASVASSVRIKGKGWRSGTSKLL